MSSCQFCNNWPILDWMWRVCAFALTFSCRSSMLKRDDVRAVRLDKKYEHHSRNIVEKLLALFPRKWDTVAWDWRRRRMNKYLRHLGDVAFILSDSLFVYLIKTRVVGGRSSSFFFETCERMFRSSTYILWSTREWVSPSEGTREDFRPPFCESI